MTEPKKEYLKKGFTDAFGKTWSDREIEVYNHQVKTFNYCIEKQPECIEKARAKVSEAFHYACGGSVKVSG